MEARNGTTCVMLIPTKTSTDAFHAVIWDARRHKPRPNVQVRFLDERPQFLLDGKLPLDKDGKVMGARQDHMVVVFWGHGKEHTQNTLRSGDKRKAPNCL